MMGSRFASIKSTGTDLGLVVHAAAAMGNRSHKNAPQIETVKAFGAHGRAVRREGNAPEHTQSRPRHPVVARRARQPMRHRRRRRARQIETVKVAGAHGRVVQREGNAPERTRSRPRHPVVARSARRPTRHRRRGRAHQIETAKAAGAHGRAVRQEGNTPERIRSRPRHPVVARRARQPTRHRRRSRARRIKTAKAAGAHGRAVRREGNTPERTRSRPRHPVVARRARQPTLPPRMGRVTPRCRRDE